MTKLILTLAALGLLTACENPVKRALRNAEYSGYEVFGVQKRDLLKDRIKETREGENEAAETFKDSLTKLRKLYNMPETALSKNFATAEAAYDRSEQKAKQVRSSREAMETVANDLFQEWEGELEQIQSSDLKASSRSKLANSRKKFEVMNRGMITAQKKMDPVLSKLKDQMLYLKHDLNAESLAELKKESHRIEGDIDALMLDMKKATAQSEQFIKSWGTN